MKLRRFGPFPLASEDGDHPLLVEGLVFGLGLRPFLVLKQRFLRSADRVIKVPRKQVSFGKIDRIVK
jgi:hypothetical protein